MIGDLNQPLPPKQQYPQETCSKCHQDKLCRICEICHGFFCEDCESQFDPNFCSQCLSNENTNFRTTNGIVDDEGITHVGRVIDQLGEAYKTSAQMISEMTEFQLEGHIERYKTLVYEAEKILDYRRIKLAHGETELEERKAISRRKARSTQRAFNTKKIASAPQVTAKGIFEALKAKGITEEKLREILRKKRETEAKKNEGSVQ